MKDKLKSDKCPDFNLDKEIIPIEELFIRYLELEGRKESLLVWRDANYSRISPQQVKLIGQSIFSEFNDAKICSMWFSMITTLIEMFGESNILKRDIRRKNSPTSMYIFSGIKIIRKISNMGLARKHPRQEKNKNLAYHRKEKHEEYLLLENSEG